MLRTNLSFLSFAEQLHQSGQVHVKHFPKGSIILGQGDKVSKVYILQNGITKCYYSAENGKSYILEFLSVGQIIGEIELVKKMDCLCSVEAITDVYAFVLPIPLVVSLLQTDLRFNKILIGELAERLTNTSSRSSFQQIYTIEHALKKLLALQSKLTIPLAKEDMAAYLGITLRSLNRLLKEHT
jgi:CRP/FNR family transcriptional regulator, anaerobic regulatory protein